MPRSVARHNDDHDDDDWDDSDAADSDEDDTITCPHCRREIYADAVRCPHCENYLSDDDEADKNPDRKPWWIGVGVAVCLYIVYRWIVG